MTDSEFRDWVALTDQVLAEVKDIAKIERAHFEALLNAGFTRGEALILTAHFQKTLIGGDGEGEG